VAIAAFIAFDCDSIRQHSCQVRIAELDCDSVMLKEAIKADQSYQAKAADDVPSKVQS